MSEPPILASNAPEQEQGGLTNQPMSKRVTSYDPKALAKYRRINYNEAIKGHYNCLPSANTLRNAVPLGVNIDSGAERFKSEVPGGHMATTFHVGSSFTKGQRIYKDPD